MSELCEITPFNTLVFASFLDYGAKYGQNEKFNH